MLFSPVRFKIGYSILLCISQFFLFQNQNFAQNTPLPRHSTAEWLTERHLILGNSDGEIHPEIKPFSRKDVAKLAVENFLENKTASPVERKNFQYLVDENSEFVEETYLDTVVEEQRADFQMVKKTVVATKQFRRENERPLLGIFYKTPANFFEVNTEHFRLKANPILNFNFGKDNRDDEGGLLFANQRGLEVRGDVDEKVWFSTNVLETQQRFPNYVNQFIAQHNAVPGNGLYKRFASKIFDTENAYDFANAQAAVGFNATQHIAVELGHGRSFIGNGYRSMLLSDFANNNFYLKLNTRVWRFHYQNLFMELTPAAYKPAAGDSILPKKFAAVHYLNYKITPKLSFGFFEATIFNRSQDFELQYLNPVILYRTVEQAIGSPDNILIGLNGRWDVANHFQFYGQFLLDEFSFNFLFKAKQRGYWGNKSGMQLGAKYINVLNIKGLDLQAELNRARPFTYSHTDTLNAYTHYRQPLAHPRGSNFREILLLLRYQPLPKVTVQARVIFSKYGENYRQNDTLLNYGNDPLLGSDTRFQDFGNKMFQGATARQTIFGIEANWQFYHNMFLDLRAFRRKKDSSLDAFDLETSVFSMGLRMNLWQPSLDF